MLVIDNYEFVLAIHNQNSTDFSQTVKISILNDKIKNLNHYIAMKEHNEKK